MKETCVINEHLFSSCREHFSLQTNFIPLMLFFFCGCEGFLGEAIIVGKVPKCPL